MADESATSPAQGPAGTSTVAPVLELDGLTSGYNGSAVLRDVSLTVRPGEVVALLGANGAGKTTTLLTISGIVKPMSGRVLYCGSDCKGNSPDARARLGVAHVPDGRGTFTDLTVEENLRLGAYIRRDRNEVKADFERVFGYFPRLAERRRQQAGTLSGGEQQMLAIARALLLRPSLLLLDEPSFGLAPLIVADIFKILRAINRTDRVSLLIVEQNANLALELADRAYLIETGRVVIGGPAATIRNDDSVRRAYLGY